MSERFHVKIDLSAGPVVLDGPEAHHLRAVCRLRPGDLVCLFNGDGHEYPARVTAVDRREVALEVVERRSPGRESPLRLHIAAALPKGDRAQVLIEKLTELGTGTFTPLLTRRGVVQPGEGKRDKLERYVVEASKQCGRNVLMQIDSARPWAEFVTDAGLPPARLLAQPGAPEALGVVARGLEAAEVVAAVGPEGGWTDEEVALAVSAGWRPVSLGPRVLRVETAALAIAAVLLTH